jgi:hypothetical protein
MPTPLIHQVGRTHPARTVREASITAGPRDHCEPHLTFAKHDGSNRGAAVVPTARRAGPREHGRQAARSERSRTGRAGELVSRNK